MAIRPCVLSAITISLGVSVSAAQLSRHPLKKCDDPKVPIGLLPKGFGTVAFALGRDGRPDTTSIAVLKTISLTPAALHSVAARRLSTCRFDMGAAAPTAPVRVTSDLTFADSDRVLVGDAMPAPTDGTPLAIEPLRIPKDSFPLPIDDARVEERPRRMSCGPPRTPAPIHVTGRGSSAADARQDAQDQIRAVAQQYNDANSGVLVAQVRVDLDGRPGSQVRVISITNAMAAQNLAEQIGSCRFTPGRVNGVAVPAFVVTRVP